MGKCDLFVIVRVSVAKKERTKTDVTRLKLVLFTNKTNANSYLTNIARCSQLQMLCCGDLEPPILLQQHEPIMKLSKIPTMAKMKMIIHHVLLVATLAELKGL